MLYPVPLQRRSARHEVSRDVLHERRWCGVRQSWCWSVVHQQRLWCVHCECRKSRGRHRDCRSGTRSEYDDRAKAPCLRHDTNNVRTFTQRMLAASRSGALNFNYLPKIVEATGSCGWLSPRFGVLRLTATRTSLASPALPSCEARRTSPPRNSQLLDPSRSPLSTHCARSPLPAKVRT